jgi:predicted double-glycine peptidase
MLKQPPDVRQSLPYDCGPAAVRAALFAGGTRPADVPEAIDMIAELGTTPEDGTDPRAVEGYLRRRGLPVVSGTMTTADLAHFTRTGRPVICLVTRHFVGHYVCAWKVARGVVHYHDPADGPRKMRAAEFAASWRDWCRSGLVYERFGLALGEAG